MRKKINSALIITALTSIVVTMLLITIVYYGLLRRQVTEELKAYVTFICRYDVVEEIRGSGVELHQDDPRITLIDEAGQVVYDNEADENVMENHSERPEVKAAFADGEGQAIRRSDTLEKNTFYYALRLEDGSVLRVAREAASLYQIFFSALPGLLLTACILVVVSMVLAQYLTAKLIAPIERCAGNLEDKDDPVEYVELAPLIDMIKEQHQDLIKNARIRQEFTANVSHELKTPLTSISGYAELIESGMASDEDTVRFAKGIHKSASRLLTLINDIIRLSELDVEEENFSVERVNLYLLAETCVDMLSMNAEKHHVTISLQGEESYVNANRQMMEELLYNLCDNAIRYNNENGTVVVTVNSQSGHTVLCVEDTGIGIPKEHQERIFERFYRVDKSRSKSTGGTGLGLAIVKHILFKHDARIDLKSESGAGTRITVTFPQYHIS